MKTMKYAWSSILFCLLPTVLFGYSGEAQLLLEINQLEAYLQKVQATEGPVCSPEPLAAAQGCLAKVKEEYDEKDFWEAENYLKHCKKEAEGLWERILACSKDLDRDGISDLKDKCLNDPEIYNGYKDEDGCPDQRPKIALLTADKIEILEPVQFDQQTYELLEASKPLLKEITKIMLENPDIYLRIETHLDNSLSPQEALQTTRIQAENIKSSLISMGLSKYRLQTEWKGDQEPIVSNNSPWGKKLNRRVEFIRIR